MHQRREEMKWIVLALVIAFPVVASNVVLTIASVAHTIIVGVVSIIV
jgi:hypothetical protein